MSYFSGKRILITGGASGIGCAVAHHFAKFNSVVIIADINKSKGEKAAEQLSKFCEVMFFHTDVRSNSAVQKLMDKINQNYQGLDFACNSAGIMKSYQNCENYSEDSWDDVINTNLKGIWLCMKYQIQAMKGQGGSIVNIASTYGFERGLCLCSQ